ncbi:FK506-binding protein 3-like [Lycium barbarum]|uniref:FK506-binding protein 3-like n=1 Tax=Lycium barbarum TaxID=112863 RepID=UPI00293E3D27|nr:FK506-binding protein 3-like [Lycium barbarum]
MPENHCFANRTLPPAVVFHLNQQHQQTSEVPRLAKPSLSVDYFMSRFSFEEEEFIEEEEEEEEEFANDVSESILDDEEIIEEEEEEEEEFEVEISENSETIRTRMEFAHSMEIDQQQPPHIPSGTIDQVQPIRARAPRMRVSNNYVRHTFQVPQYSILDSDEEDEEIYEEEEEEEYNELVDHQDMSEYLETRTYYYDPVMDIDVNEGDEEIYEEEEEEEYNELVDHQDMSEYLETRTYYYDPVMDIDVNEGDPVVGDEEQETCAICLLEYKDEDTIGTLQCGHGFRVGCIKKWLQRKKECPFCRAPVLTTV